MGVLRKRPRAFVYAVLVHLLLLAVLVFSLDWAPSIKPSASSKPAPVQAVVVDAAKLDAEVQRQKQQEQQKERAAQEKLKRMEDEARAAEQKRVQEEKRVADLKHQQEQRKQAEEKRKTEAAAAQKAEAEKKRKAEAEKQRREEQQRKAEAEKKRQAEQRRKAEAEKKRQEEEQRKAEAEKQRRENEARKAAEAEMQARLAAEQERLATQRRSAMQRMIDEYVLYIQEKVQRSWIRPPSSGGELSCTVEVRLIPSGEVIDAQIVRSSGNTAFDRSVEAAVFKASPLPVPPDAEVMQQFRSLRFEFKPGS